MKEKIGLSGGAEILVKCLDSGDLELQKKASFLLRSLSVNGIYICIDIMLFV